MYGSMYECMNVRMYGCMDRFMDRCMYLNVCMDECMIVWLVYTLMDIPNDL